MKNMKLLKLRNNIFLWTIILVFLIVTLFPIYWMVVSAFRESRFIQAYPPDLLPGHVTFENYINIFTRTRFIVYLKNSVLVGSVVVLIVIFCGSLAGYSFSRFRHKFRNIFMVFILSIQMFPLVGILIPLYTTFIRLKLTNTYIGLIFAHCIFTMPFAVWFLKGFFDTIPKSIDEAGYIDGCTRLGVLFWLIVPLLKPAILATSMYAFMLSWDDYLFCLTINTDPFMRNLPVGIAIESFGEYGQNWGYIMAFSSAALVIPFVAFVFLQKYMVSGLTRGAIKG